METDDIINQVKTSNSKIKEIDLSLNEVCKSICKIIYQNKFGTGFFIKLYKNEKEILCLMTNQHVIRKEMIESKEIIDIKYNCEKKWIKIKLDEKQRYIKYNEEMDITIIEIKPEDEIKKKYFLFPNINNIDYKDKEIYIVQFPEGKKLSYSEGKIEDIKEYEIIYDASTISGSSGSPILLKNSTEVIGIHKKGHINKKRNYGTLVTSIIQLLNSDNKNYFLGNQFIINDQKFVYENGEFYIGQSLNGKRHGKGIHYYPNGDIKYDGYWINDKPEGNGKYIYENGDYYIGQNLNGLKNGKGIDYYSNGNIKYNGDYVKGERVGMGKYIWEDGVYYIGQWNKNKRNGKGTLYDKKGKIMYEGDFVNGKYEGNGYYIFDNGEYYIGQWKNGQKNGKGILYFNDEIIYDGDYVNDKKEGFGKYIYSDGTYYIGQWYNNKRHGKGILYEEDDNIKYEGEFYNGEKATTRYVKNVFKDLEKLEEETCILL